jgi:3-methylfumaryl-CoA hydratase
MQRLCRGLGVDGLPLERGVLPRLPLPRRMYAGVALTFHSPILVGDTLRRGTEFTDVQMRNNSTGSLIQATTTRRIHSPRGLTLTEDSHSVFREAVSTGTKSGILVTEPPPDGMQWSRTIVPDPVTLFRYSALTFKPHRIHCDRPFAKEQEGYPGLVAHGAVHATMPAGSLARQFAAADPFCKTCRSSVFGQKYAVA